MKEGFLNFGSVALILRFPLRIEMRLNPLSLIYPSLSLFILKMANRPRDCMNEGSGEHRTQCSLSVEAGAPVYGRWWEPAARQNCGALAKRILAQSNPASH